MIPSKEYMPVVLSIICTLGFFGVLIGLFYVKNEPILKQHIDLMIGSLISNFSMVMSFWIGSSSGSKSKDDLIEKQSEFK